MIKMQVYEKQTGTAYLEENMQYFLAKDIRHCAEITQRGEDEIRDELWPSEKVVARVNDLVKEIDETEEHLHELIRRLQLYMINETDRGRLQIQQMVKDHKYEQTMKMSKQSRIHSVEPVS